MDMFNAEIDALGYDLTAYTFVYNNTNSMIKGDIVDTTSLTTVGLVGHTPLNSARMLNVNNIVDDTVFGEGTRMSPIE